jgi:hypothetical protein
MIFHGLDKDDPPSAAKAKSMLEEIHGSWWNVYTGGPRRGTGATGWTPEVVRDYAHQGISAFILTYVGRQILPAKHIDDRHLLTTAQGRSDGDEACEIAARFGYGAPAPLCLDLEGETFRGFPQGSLDYACGWSDAVRTQGLRPGVYSNPDALLALADRGDRPDWIWVAKWVTNKVDPDADPHRIPDVRDGAFPDGGQRVWQYGGEFKKDKPAVVGGVTVDINVADGACLVGTPGASTAMLAGGLTIADATTRQFFETKFKEVGEHADDLFRLADHGATTPGHGNNHQRILGELTNLRTEMNDKLDDLDGKLDLIAGTEVVETEHSR